MTQISLTEAEAKLAAACIEVNADSFYGENMGDTAAVKAYDDAKPKVDGTTITLDPPHGSSQDLMWQLYNCPCNSRSSGHNYDPSGFDVDDISSLAMKLREAGVTEPKARGVPEGRVVRTLDELPDLSGSFQNLWDGKITPEGIADMVLQSWEISPAIKGDDLRGEIRRRLGEWLKSKGLDSEGAVA